MLSWFLDVSCLTTSTSDLNNENNFQINIFPNPAGNQLAIGSGQWAIYSIEVLDMLGQCIFSQKPTANSQQQVLIDISAFKPGIYFVKVETEKGIAIKKIVKPACHK